MEQGFEKLFGAARRICGHRIKGVSINENPPATFGGGRAFRSFPDRRFNSGSRLTIKANPSPKRGVVEGSGRLFLPRVQEHGVAGRTGPGFEPDAEIAELER